MGKLKLVVQLLSLVSNVIAWLKARSERRRGAQEQHNVQLEQELDEINKGNLAADAVTDDPDSVLQDPFNRDRQATDGDEGCVLRPGSSDVLRSENGSSGESETDQKA